MSTEDTEDRLVRLRALLEKQEHAIERAGSEGVRNSAEIRSLRREIAALERQLRPGGPKLS